MNICLNPAYVSRLEDMPSGSLRRNAQIPSLAPNFGVSSSEDDEDRALTEALDNLSRQVIESVDTLLVVIQGARDRGTLDQETYNVAVEAIQAAYDTGRLSPEHQRFILNVLKALSGESG